MHAYTLFFIVERKKKKGSPAICDDFLAVSTLTGREDALLDTVDL